jgi:predicted transport protein
MPLFSIKGKKLDKIEKIDFKLEKDLQKLTEDNLGIIFNNLEFITTELQLDNLRIDTLAFDNDTNSFVIIEYKKGHHYGLVDQGIAYLGLLHNNKGEFVAEYNELKDKRLKRNDIDWSQSKIIFISPRFNTYQLKSTEFRGFPFELWEVSLYNNNSLLFNEIKPQKGRESFDKVMPDDEKLKNVNKEVKTYSEHEHLKNLPEDIKELYGEIKDRIMDLSPNIDIKPTKLYVAFYSNNNFVYTFFFKKQINFVLNLKVGKLKDPEKIARDISEIGHQGYGDYRVTVKPGADLDYLMLLIKQAFKNNS